MNKKSALIHFCLLCVTAGSARAATVYVRVGASGAGTGVSWTDAYTDLSIALLAAQPGDQVWVAAGTYTPPDESSSFVLRTGVGVYGGFAGTEAVLSARDPALHVTTLSGDIGQDDTEDTSPFAPPWPGNINLHTPNAGHVVIASGVDATAVLDGFHVIRGAYGPNGLPAGDTMLYGSGVYCIGGSPTITHCMFHDNLASFGNGGAMFLLNASPTITHCSFSRNLAHQGSGGAVYCGGRSQPVIQDCTFSGNLAVSYAGQTGQGGAVQLDCSVPVTISRCVFDGNTARAFGGGSFEIPRAGAVSSFCIYNGPITTTLRECTFRNNVSTMGGAVFVWNPTTVVNCTFDHNTALVEGAGLCAQWTTLTLINSTIAHNTGAESAGLLALESPPSFPAQAVIRNSVIWGNTAVGQDVSPRNAGVRGPYTARNSCIQDMFTSDPGEDPIDPSNFPGCIATDPMLSNASGGDVRLLAGSPCIDAGTASYMPGWVAGDRDGNTRVVRGLPGTGPAVVDMGAHEFGAALSCLPVLLMLPASADVCPNASVTLRVHAEGSGPFSYQWRRNGVNITTAIQSEWTVAGSSPNAPGTYDCRVTNACGAMLTQPSLVSVSMGVEDYTQSETISVCDGAPLALQSLFGYWRQPTFQWRLNGVDLPGATSAAYFQQAFQSSMAGVYTCVATTECGTVTSAPITVVLASCGPACDSIDFNADGLFPDTMDIDDFLSVFSGGSCSNDPSCGDIDFNNDGLFPDTADIDALLSVFSGGPCIL